MFAAAAIAAGVAVADVTSANIVGYLGQDKQAQSPSFGACFNPVAGGIEYKLGDMTVVSDDDTLPFDPDSEYLQELDEATTVVKARYTCLTHQLAEYFRSEDVEDPDTADLIDQNLGWWDFEFGKTIDNVCYAGKGVNRDEKTFKIGQGFLCYISDAATRTFTTSGAVNQDAVGIDYLAQSPLIANFVPVAFPLSRITVVSDDDTLPFDPDSEYLQVLDPDTTVVKARYTCLTHQLAEYFRSEDVEDPDTADLIDQNLGWWDFEFGKTIQNVCYDETATYRGNETVNPGDAFLCYISDAAKRTFNFPAAVEKESK